jgi:iron(III) transport system ATP-binding protein
MLTLIGMTSQRNSRPAQLSGGQQQRVSLARALAPSPELILLDEPFSALDANMRSTMRDEVTAIIRKTESTAIIVTHDQEEAMSISDKVVVLLNGTVAQFGSPQEIYESPRSSHVARFIGDANLLSAIVDRGRAFHAIGSSQCTSSAQRVVALVRPEHIRLSHNPHDGHAGVVESRSYFGHDGTLGIRLATGEIVTARLPISDLADIGSTVFVASIDTATILDN